MRLRQIAVVAKRLDPVKNKSIRCLVWTMHS